MYLQPGKFPSPLGLLQPPSIVSFTGYLSCSTGVLLIITCLHLISHHVSISVFHSFSNILDSLLYYRNVLLSSFPYLYLLLMFHLSPSNVSTCLLPMSPLVSFQCLHVSSFNVYTCLSQMSLRVSFHCLHLSPFNVSMCLLLMYYVSLLK